MTTLRVYQRPVGFHLPNWRRTLYGEDDESFAFCKHLETDVIGFQRYRIGLTVRETKNIEWPEEHEMGTLEIDKVSSYIYSLYNPERDNLLFAVGPSYDGLDKLISLLAQINELQTKTFNLNTLHSAWQRGLIQLKGCAFTCDNGTTKQTKRKLDGTTFPPTDGDLNRSGTVKNALEVQLPIGNIYKAFLVYPDGRITARGRHGLRVDDFARLRGVYTHIRSYI